MNHSHVVCLLQDSLVSKLVLEMPQALPNRYELELVDAIAFLFHRPLDLSEWFVHNEPPPTAGAHIHLEHQLGLRFAKLDSC